MGLDGSLRKLMPHIAAVLAGVVLASLALVSGSAEAAPNTQINYQGKLTNNANAAVPDGNYNFRFRLCTGNAGGACSGAVVMDETYSGAAKLPVAAGLFSAMLGTASSSLASVDFNQDLYLEIQVGGSGSPVWETLSPVKRLAMTPNAFNAQKLGGLATSSFLRSDQLNSAATSINSSSTYSTYLGAVAGLSGVYISSWSDLFGSGFSTTSADIWDLTKNRFTTANATSSFSQLISPYYTAAYNSSTFFTLAGWYATSSQFLTTTSAASTYISQASASSLFVSASYLSFVSSTYGSQAYNSSTFFSIANWLATTSAPQLTNLNNVTINAVTSTQASSTYLYVSGTSLLGTTTIANLAVTNFATSTFFGGLAVSSSQFVVQQATGNVGIGTSSPYNPLSVGVDTGSNSKAVLVLGSGANVNNFLSFNGGRSSIGYGSGELVGGALTINAGNGKGIEFLVNGTNGTFLSGTNAMTILSTGNVGIGTTSPDSLLQVGGLSSYFKVSSLGNATATGYLSVGSTLSAGSTTITNLSVTTLATSTFAGGLAVGSTQLVVQQASGFVGIGTSSPAWSLQVAGVRPSIALTDTNAAVNAKNWVISSMGGSLYIGTSTDLNVTSTPSALALTASGNLGLGVNNPTYVFEPRATSTNGAIIAVWDGSSGYQLNRLGVNKIGAAAASFGYSGFTNFTISNSNVGIGTTSPAYLLQTGSVAAKTYFSVDASGNTTSSGTLAVGMAAGANSVLELRRQGSLKWSLGNNATGDYFTISTSSLNSNSILTISSSTGYITVGNTTASTTSMFSVYVGNSVWGGVNNSTGAWQQSSDARLKGNISDLSLETPLQKLLGLRPVRYDWKSDPLVGAGRHIGFIAQEVEPIFPELVSTGGNGMKTISYAEFAPILTGAIQEQQGQIDLLRAELSSSTPVAAERQSSGISVANSSSFASLSVADSADFIGTITVRGEANFESKVTFYGETEFKGHISVAADSAGTALIPRGATSTAVTFKTAYGLMPRIAASLLSSGTPTFLAYLVSDKSVSGFKLIIDQPAPNDLYFDWLALSADDQGGLVAGVSVGGCADAAALNYDPTATASDGSCQYALPAPEAAEEVISSTRNVIPEATSSDTAI